MFEKKRDHCPLCGSEKICAHYFIERYEKKFHTSRCSDCGFIFMNPVLNDREISSLYCEDYYSGDADYSYTDERRKEQSAAHVWDRRIKVIRKYAGGGNFLDVGCSFGGLLSRAEPFFSPHGIEISPYAAEYAEKKFPGRIHRGTLSDHPFEKNFFSAVTMIELIEHLKDPAAAVRECFSLLRPGGVLVVQTANMAGRQAVNLGKDYAYYMPGHLSYFTMENLTGLLEQTGFRKTKVYCPVEFGLLPKLMKSRGDFSSLSDYSAWFRISSYHMKSLIHFRNFAMTSSMVIYAVK